MISKSPKCRPAGFQPWNERCLRGWHPLPADRPRVSMGDVLQRRFAHVAVLLLAVLVHLPAVADDMLQQQSGSLLLQMQSGYRPATRINTDVHMQVSGLVARVTVRQAFRNDGSEWVEGIYVFPLPDSAAVDRLRLEAGERVIVGEIREKAAARKSYEQAKQEGRRASLVGQQRSNLFTTSVANIAPGETVVIEIAYLETVTFDDGTFSLRFPTTLTPRYIPGRPLPDRQGSGWSADTDRVPDASLITPPVVTSSTDHRLSLRAEIDAGMPLAIVASRYHPIEVTNASDRYLVSLASANEVTDHDLELLWRPVAASRPEALLFGEVLHDRRHLLLMLMPPAGSAAAAELPPRDLTFVIDTSGSMHGTSMEQAKKAVLLALDDLQPGDRFNLLQFNSVTESLFPHSMPASADNLRTAISWIGGLRANGGTEMRPALQRALAGGDSAALRQVVFVTDGAVGNEAELFELIDSQLGNTRLFTVGIGSAPNGLFMRKAAEAGRGTFVLVSALHEVQEKMTRLLKRLSQPQLTDITLEWPDGLQPQVYPARVADLYVGEPVVVRARIALAPRPGDQLVVRGNAAGGPWSAQVALATASDHPGVAAQWARARIGELLDGERVAEDGDALRAAVVETALGYGLVSRYTSLVAVDRTPVRPRNTGLASEQVPNLLPYGQSQQAIFGFPATATAGPWLRLTGGVCLMLAALLFLLRVCTVRGPGRVAAART